MAWRKDYGETQSNRDQRQHPAYRRAMLPLLEQQLSIAHQLVNLDGVERDHQHEHYRDTVKRRAGSSAADQRTHRQQGYDRNQQRRVPVRPKQAADLGVRQRQGAPVRWHQIKTPKLALPLGFLANRGGDITAHLGECDAMSRRERFEAVALHRLSRDGAARSADPGCGLTHYPYRVEHGRLPLDRLETLHVDRYPVIRAEVRQRPGGHIRRLEQRCQVACNHSRDTVVERCRPAVELVNLDPIRRNLDYELRLIFRRRDTHRSHHHRRMRCRRLPPPPSLSKSSARFGMPSLCLPLLAAKERFGMPLEIVAQYAQRTG